MTLTDDRVDLDRGEILIPRNLNKSRKSKPISLARFEVQLLREQLLARPAGSRFAFATMKGGRYSESGFRSVWTPALVGVGLAHEATNERGEPVIVARGGRNQTLRKPRNVCCRVVLDRELTDVYLLGLLRTDTLNGPGPAASRARTA